MNLSSSQDDLTWVCLGIDGKITFSDLKAFRDKPDLRKELEARNALPPGDPNFTTLKNALKDNETERLRNLPENVGVPNEDIDKMAKHFVVLCQETVFSFVNEE